MSAEEDAMAEEGPSAAPLEPYRLDARAALRHISKTWCYGDSRTRLTTLVETYRGRKVCLEWPPGHELVLGDRACFGVKHVARRMRLFRQLHGKDFVSFLGLLQDTSRRPQRPEQTLWFLVVSNEEVYGYLPPENRLYFLAVNLEHLLRHGVRSVDALYARDPDTQGRERLWYGYSPPGECYELMLRAQNSDWLLDSVKNLCGLRVENTEDTGAIVVGTAEFLKVTQFLPREVLAALRAAGFAVIAMTTRFERVVLLERRTKEVYALMSDSHLFKLADDLKAFFRRRLKPLENAVPLCFLSSGDTSRYVRVGEQKRFPCPVGYTVPGDAELLAYWVSTHMNIRGWPGGAAAAGDD